MSVLRNINRLGRCTLCEVEIYNIKKTYPNSHEYAGEAVVLGGPLDNLRYVSLILVNGNQCRITMCKDCAETPEEDWISQVWHKIVNTWKMDLSDHHRELIGAKINNPEQKDKQRQQLEYLTHNHRRGQR